MSPDLPYDFGGIEATCTIIAKVLTARGTANARIENHRLELTDDKWTYHTTVSPATARSSRFDSADFAS